MRICALVILLCCVVASAQKNQPSSTCGPSPEVATDLKQLIPETLPHDKKSAILRELLTKYPNDLFVHGRYQEAVRSRRRKSELGALIEEYRGMAVRYPDSLRYQYLYARTLTDTDAPQAMDLLQKAIATDPSYPWPYLGLAVIGEFGRFVGAMQFRSDLDSFLKLCPNSLDAEFWDLVAHHATSEMAAVYSKPLRNTLAADVDPDHLQFWATVWDLEFKGFPVAEHDELRRQIADDLKMLTQVPSDADGRRLALRRHGYQLVSDKVAVGHIEEELLSRYPRSVEAGQVFRERWYEDHPFPKADGPAKQQTAYYQAEAKMTEEQLRLYSSDWRIWRRHLKALAELKSSTEEQMVHAAGGFLEAVRRDGSVFILPPPEFQVADVYLRKKIRAEQVPALVQQGLKGFRALQFRSDRQLTQNGGLDDEELFLRIPAADLLAEAARQLKRPGFARAAVDDLQGTSPKDPYLRSELWALRARFAESEGRKLDALLMYQAAIDNHPADDYPEADRLVRNEQRLWKELGGTDASRDFWNRNPNRAVAIPGDWKKPTTTMAAWELTDLDGHSWKLRLLEGKALLINVWATWCRPCQDELDNLQKLYEQVKERSDIQILTFNVDEEIGMVAPYIRKRGYTFTVLLAKQYVDELKIEPGIPRSWIVDARGTWLWDRSGFEPDPLWQTKMLEKLKASETSR